MKEYHKITTFYERAGTPYKVKPQLVIAKPEFRAIQEWIVEEKVDGTNTRIILNGYGVEFAGRTSRAQFSSAIKEFFQETITPKLQKLPISNPMVIFGETVGPKINGNPYGLDTFQFYGFDVWLDRHTDAGPDPGWGYWLDRSEVFELFLATGIQRAPYLCDMQGRDAKTVLFEARSRLPGNKTDYFEGLIARPQVELFNQRGRRVIWKLKRRDF